MPLASSLGLALPDYARLDLAWTESIPLTIELGVTTNYIVPGQYIDVLLSATANYVTSAVAFNRSFELVIEDADRKAVMVLPSPQAQAASTSYVYSFVSGISSAYFNQVSNIVVPLPEIPMMPGWIFSLTNNTFEASDSLRNPSALIMHIPTGPALASESLIPTPVLV